MHNSHNFFNQLYLPNAPTKPAFSNFLINAWFEFFSVQAEKIWYKTTTVNLLINKRCFELVKIVINLRELLHWVRFMYCSDFLKARFRHLSGQIWHYEFKSWVMRPQKRSKQMNKHLRISLREQDYMQQYGWRSESVPYFFSFPHPGTWIIKYIPPATLQKNRHHPNTVKKPPPLLVVYRDTSWVRLQCRFFCQVKGAAKRHIRSP